MFCVSCGNQMNEGSSFCPKCGIPVSKQSSSNQEYASVAPKYSNNVFREVDISYIDSIRISEFLCHEINNKYYELEARAKKLGIQLHFEEPYLNVAPNSKFKYYMIWFVIFTIIITYFAWTIGSFFLVTSRGIVRAMTFVEVISPIAICCCLGFAIYFLVRAISDKIAHKKLKDRYLSQFLLEFADYQQNVSLDKERVEKELKEKKILMAKLEQLKKEYYDANKTRESLYSVNIIPKQYRGLQPIFYLYEYLSTSKLTLENALVSFDMNAIKSHLNIISQQNTEILYRLQDISENLDEIRMQNDELFNSLQKFRNESQISSEQIAQSVEMTNKTNQALETYAEINFWNDFIKTK